MNQPARKRVLCFGDSNTYGYRPYDGRWGRDVRWTGRLATLLGPTWQVIEEGLNGRSVGSFDELWPERNGMDVLGGYIRRYRPLDRLIVMLGTNDALFAPPDAVGEDMDTLLARAVQALEGDNTRILLLSPAGAWSPEVPGLAPVYRQLAAKYGVDFADCAAWGLTMAEDGCHFSADAHAVFAAAVADILQAE